MLVNEGLISSAILDTALTEQKKSGRRLGRVLVDSMLVTEEAIGKALARQLNVPFIDLKQSPVDPAALKLLPESPARRLRVMPLKVMADGLLVGMSDPGDLFAYDELARLTNKDIHVAVVTESDLLTAYDR
ncbi:MAG: MSHA biogenesis protein MshE, partial [Hydrogenophilales bacterium 12-63-5]